MFSKLSTSLIILTCVTRIAAHIGTIRTFFADGVKYAGWDYAVSPANPPVNTSPEWQKVVDSGGVGANAGANSNNYWVLNSPGIICNDAAVPAPTSATVKAGGNVTINWSYFDRDHSGPILTYMADCKGPCETVHKESLEWFKIQESGLLNRTKVPTWSDGTPFPENETTGTWPVQKMVDQDDYNYTVQIPPTLAPGRYVLRQEIIGLHRAIINKEIQAYPFCFNFNVTGSGTVSPPKGVVGTKLYSVDEPAFYYDVYAPSDPLPEFPIPGPPVWDGK